MTVLQRAATIAVMSFSLSGLLGHSTPGYASALDRTAITATVPIDASDPLRLPIAAVDTVPAPSAEEAGFGSLSDAVAAQDEREQSEAVQCLAGAIYFESKGEPLTGQLAVANVIINRSKSGRFPADICAVVKQRGQFSFVRGGEIPAINRGSRPYHTAVAIARVALDAAWDSPAPRALYFNTPNRMPGSGLTRIAMIGNHVFYR